AAQGANVFGLGDLSSTDMQTLGDRLTHNPSLVLTAFATYFSTPLFLILTLVALFGFWERPRRGILALALLLVPVVVLIVVASDLYLRYLVIAVPGLLLLAAFGLIDLTGKFKNLKLARSMTWLPWAAVLATLGGWLIIFVAPFMTTAYHDPTE